MNREDIIRAAREAGAEFAELPMMDAIVFSVDDRQWNSKELDRFVEIVRKDYSFTHANIWLDRIHKAMLEEREACAKVAKTISDKYAHGYYGNEVDTADEIEAAIRARGQA